MQKKDFVSLAEARPDLAAEWNYEKNGDLRPEDVTCKSNKKVWWKLSYDVPMDYKVEKLRGKHFKFEWEAVISSRSNGNDSVNLRSPSPDVDGVSDSPYTSSNLRTDGQPKVDRGLPSIDDCPYLSGNTVWPGFNDLQTINPELAEQWHPTKNGNLTPSQVTYGSKRKVWWLLLYNDSKTEKYFNFER